MKSKNLYPIFSDPTIHNTGKVIYWYMNAHGARNNNFYHSKRTIANELNISSKTVERHIKTLEREGYIQVINRFRKNGGKTSNKYIILK